MRALRLLAAFLLTLLPAFAGGAGWERSWPDLAIGGTAVSSLRASPAGGLQVTGSSSLANLTQYVDYAPDWASPSGLRFTDGNFYVTGSGAANPELCTGNPITINFRKVNVGGTVNTSTGAITGGTWYTVTWGGSQTVTIADCEFIRSDPLRDASGNVLSFTTGAAYFTRTSVSVAAAGQGIPTNSKFLPRYSHQYWGDGTEWTATPQVAKATSGNIAAFSNGSAGYIPTYVTFDNWDGAHPVALLVGDSICNWQADYDFSGSRPAYGYMARALDDAASGRWSFANFCSSGTKPQDQSSVATGQYKLRMRALFAASSNRPFNRIVSNMAQNGFFNTLSLSSFQAVETSFWNFFHLYCPTCSFYQTTFPPHPSAVNNSFWSDQANQTTTAGDVNYYPTGLRFTLMAWLEGLGGGTYTLPSWVRALPIETAFADSTYPDHWKTNSTPYTLPSGVSSGVSSFTVDGPVAPTNGDAIVLNPGTSNAETRNIYAVTGSSTPWTVFVISNTSKTHATGSAALISYTSDGTHPTATLDKGAAALLIGYKNSSLLN